MAASSATCPDSQSADELFKGAMPKEDIGALRLIEQNASFDGRGCTVAIFDTGVDPAAAGLSETSDGKPKVVDVIDCTGSGDVKMTVASTPEAGVLTGEQGKRLRLGDGWTNPSGEWRIGAKPLYELYPQGCKRRVQQRRKERWLEAQRKALAAATADAAALSKESSREWRAEVEERCKLLKAHGEAASDAGPLVHAVVWHDGHVWRAALDTSDLFEEGSGEGALADFEPMTDFKRERQYGTFSALDACNFALNIYDDGATLSIVVDTGAHGTHVAGITAAHHAEAPAFNGVAPGAQIVSCKIGDTRVSGMETGPGLVRGLVAAVEAGADVINMSYGEPTMTPNLGRFVELAREVVNVEGVIFVASAGNSGPGLTTVGAPGGTSSCIISIGAYVTPELARTGHAVRGSHPTGWQGQQYNWSSRGPTADGDVGVTVCAPGGAIAPVPQWSQQSRQLMNGTSMSSPNACGGIALLVSALKQLGAPVSPARIRRAIENTAKRVHERPEDTLAYGSGLLQVDAALDYLQRSEEVDKPDARYDVRVRPTDGQVTGRGVYLRDPGRARSPSSHTVTVTPVLHRDADVRDEKLAVEARLRLTSSEAWVMAPAQLLLPHNGRDFEIRVDPTALPPGVHYAEVQGVDAAAPWRGALVRVPVTVCVPEAGVDAASSSNEVAARSVASRCSRTLGPLDFSPGREHRRFVSVPLGASWAEMTVRAGSYDVPKLFMVHTTQLLPHRRPLQSRAAVTLSSEGVHVSSFEVHGGVTLEVALAQMWKTNGHASVTVDLAFHGVQPSTERVAFDGPELVTPLTVYAPLRRSRLMMKAALSTLRVPLRPTASRILPQTGRRDALPSGRILHQLLLTYVLKLAEGGSVTIAVPPLRAAVYDGALEGQLFAVYDGNKRRVAFGDVYPEAAALKKGEYTIHLSLRHDSVEVLEKLQDLPIRAEKALENEIVIPVHNRLASAVLGEKGVKEQLLREGERRSYFLGPVPEDSLPKDAKPGCSLSGSLKVAKTSALAGDKAAPPHLNIVYSLAPPKREKDNKGEDGAGDDEAREPAAVLRESRRDADVKCLKAFKAKTDAEWAAYKAMYDELITTWPEHLPIRLEHLARSADRLPKRSSSAKARRDEPDPGAKGEGQSTSEGRAERDTARPSDVEEAGTGGVAARDGDACAAVIAAADAVLRLVDEVAVAQFIANKAVAESAEERRQQKALKEQKEALVQALHMKCRAELAAAEATGFQDADATAAFEAAYGALRKWVDVTEADYVAIFAAREAYHGRYAGAVKALDKVLGDKDALPVRELMEQKASLLRKLGWHHWAQLLEFETLQAFPADFAAI